MRTGRNAWRKTSDLFRGRDIVAGDEVEEFWALKDVSFEVKRGEVLGIIGRNGAGKSTLLKVLSRITEPSEGRVTIKGRVASLLEVGTGFHPELTGRENIYLNGAILGMTRAEIKHKFDEIVAFAEVEKFLDTPVKRYSSGMYVRLAFAVAAHLEPEILIVDEVLAVGDLEFQKKCLGKMQDVAGHGRTVLFVSHNIPAVGALCGHGLVLDQGCLVADTSMEAAIAAYALQAARNKASAPNILFESDRPHQNGGAVATKLELLNPNRSPISIAESGAPVVFRIWFAVHTSIPRGSVILSLRGVSGETAVKFETSPNRIQPLLAPGTHYVDCCVDSLTLLPGQYFVSLGLAVHGVQFIDWQRDVGTITLIPSGDPEFEMSAYPEGTFAVRHRWELKGARTHSDDQRYQKDLQTASK
jgi:lipopolysaccharide transport system ATP-binding protein